LDEAGMRMLKARALVVGGSLAVVKDHEAEVELRLELEVERAGRRRDGAQRLLSRGAEMACGGDERVEALARVTPVGGRCAEVDLHHVGGVAPWMGLGARVALAPVRASVERTCVAARVRSRVVVARVRGGSAAVVARTVAEVVGHAGVRPAAIAVGAAPV